MRYLKMLRLLTVSAAALMAFAGSASATEITSSTGSTPTIHATAGTTSLHGAATIECHSSTVEGIVSSHGSSTTVKGIISKLSFANCTNNNHVTVLTDGSGPNGTGELEVHTQYTTVKDPDGTLTTFLDEQNGNGTLTSTGTRITIALTGLGLNCLYETNNTKIGTVTGTAAGGEAVLHIESAAIPRVRHSFFCGSSGIWTGGYRVTHPTGLTIH